MSSSYSLLRVFTVTLLRLNIELSTEPDASEVLFNSSKALSMKRSCCYWRRESVSAISSSMLSGERGRLPQSVLKLAIWLLVTG